jgi:hypothetical protein
MATYHQQMQAIFQSYQEEVSPDPADLKDIARWAIDKGLWRPRPADIHARFAGDMADALRDEYRVDKAGRRYRAKHAVRSAKGGQQISFWADIDSAPRTHMVKAFAQRRQQVVGDCYQLRQDVDHYNSIDSRNPPIQLILDFTADIEELLIAEGIDEAV